MVTKTHLVKQEGSIKEVGVQLRSDGLITDHEDQLVFDPISKEMLFHKNGEVYQMNLRVLDVDPGSPKEGEAWIHAPSGTIKYVKTGIILSIGSGGAASIDSITTLSQYYYTTLNEAEIQEISNFKYEYPTAMIQVFNFDTAPQDAVLIDGEVVGSYMKPLTASAMASYQEQKRSITLPNYAEGVVVTTAQGLAPFEVTDNSDGTHTLKFHKHLSLDFAGFTEFYLYEEENQDINERSSTTSQAYYLLTTAGVPAELPIVSVTDGVGAQGDETVIVLTDGGLDLTLGFAPQDIFKKVRIIPKMMVMFSGGLGHTNSLTELPVVESSATKFKSVVGEDLFTKLEKTNVGTVQHFIVKKSPNKQYVLILAKCWEDSIASATTRCWFSTDGMNTLTYDENFRSDWAYGTYGQERLAAWTYGYANHFHEDMAKVSDDGRIVFGHYYASSNSYHQHKYFHGRIGASGIKVQPFASAGGYVGIPWTSIAVHTYQSSIDVDWDANFAVIEAGDSGHTMMLVHYDIDHSQPLPTSTFLGSYALGGYHHYYRTGFVKILNMEGELKILKIATHTNGQLYAHKASVSDIRAGNYTYIGACTLSLENGIIGQTSGFHHEYAAAQTIMDWDYNEITGMLWLLVRDDTEIRMYGHNIARTRNFILPKASLSFDNTDINSGTIEIVNTYFNGVSSVGEIASITAAQVQNAGLLQTALNLAWTNDVVVTGDLVNGYVIEHTLWREPASFTILSTSLVDSGTPAITEGTTITTIADYSLKALYSGTPLGAVGQVDITADNFGTNANAITVTGDGVFTVDQLVAVWNALNIGNTATATFGGAEVPNNGEIITLSGGVDGLNGKHFVLNNAAGTVAFYYDMTGTTPAPVGFTETVAINTALRQDTAANVAIATAAIIGAHVDFSGSYLGSNVISVAHNTSGAAIDGTAGDTGYGVSITTQGVDAIPPASIVETVSTLEGGQTARYFFCDNTVRQGVYYGNDGEVVQATLHILTNETWLDYYRSFTDYSHHNEWGGAFARGNVLQIKDKTIYIHAQTQNLAGGYDSSSMKMIKIPDWEQHWGMYKEWIGKAHTSASMIQIGAAARGITFGDYFAQKFNFAEGTNTYYGKYPDNKIPLRTLKMLIGKIYGTFSRYADHNILTAKIVGVKLDGTPDMANVLGETTTKMHTRNASVYSDIKYFYFNFDDVRVDPNTNYFLIFGADETVWNPSAENIEDQGRIQIGGTTEVNADSFYRWDGSAWIHENRYMSCSFFDEYIIEDHRAAGMLDLRTYVDTASDYGFEIGMGSFGKINDDLYRLTFRHASWSQQNHASRPAHGGSGKQYQLTMTDDAANKYKMPIFSYPKPVGYTEAEFDKYLRFQIALGTDETRRIEKNMSYSETGVNGVDKYFNQVPQFGGLNFQGASSADIHRLRSETGSEIGVEDDTRFKYGRATRMYGNRIYYDNPVSYTLPYSENFITEVEFEVLPQDIDGSQNMIWTMYHLGYLNNGGPGYSRYSFYVQKWPHNAQTIYTSELMVLGYQRIRFGRDNNGLIFQRSFDGVSWHDLTIESGDTTWFENGGVIGSNTGMTANRLVLGGYDFNDSYNWYGKIGYFRYASGASTFANDEIIDQKNMMAIRNEGDYLVAQHVRQDSHQPLQDWNMQDLALIRPEQKTSKVGTPDMQHKVQGNIVQGREMGYKVEVKHSPNTKDPSAVQGLMINYYKK